MDKSSLSTITSTTNSSSKKQSPTSEVGNKFVTIPILGNLQQSLSLMNEQQVMYNLLQLNLVSMYNENILNKLYEWSRHTKFYLKNRYLLQKLINTGPKVVNMKQKPVHEIVQKYDTVYVNGHSHNENSKDKQIIKNGLKKQLRAVYISSREEFSAILDQLSLCLKQKSKQLSTDDLQAFFETQLGKINGCEIHGVVSPNKLQLIKSSSSISSSESEQVQPQQQAQQISQQSVDSPKKDKKSIFSLCYKDTLYQVKQILIDKCSFLHTKNRCPLVLDFGFSRFIFKNDNQVSHQLIAMHIIHYLNKILSPPTSPQIIEYQIIPQAHGALYQFIQNSSTVHDIKCKYPGGIPAYLDYLQSQQFQPSATSNGKLSSIRKRFAQTYVGFCLIQYLLDLKDRNNSNIMIRTDGSIFHIDLAFIFNATPGGINFQNCPFKFTKEYLSAMGGDFQSDCFKYYETLMMSSMTKLCLNREQFLAKIEIISSRKQQILCFRKFKMDNYKQKIPKKPQHVKQTVERLISDSFDNWRTNQYDDYQFNTNKIKK